ncbi:hypothetical protein [Burkholderia pseudomallei]|nr:hypothetical protein [Burkholderia pseudomallei]
MIITARTPVARPSHAHRAQLCDERRGIGARRIAEVDIADELPSGQGVPG